MTGQASRRPAPLVPDPETRARLRALWALGAPGEHTAPAAELDDIAELFARIVWSRLTEPGDAVAGALIARLGAAGALAPLVRGSSSRELAALLRDGGGEHGDPGPEVGDESLSGPVLAAALRRWRPRLAESETAGDIERALALGMCAVTPSHDAWPQQLNDLGPHAPHLLWVRGDPRTLSMPALAVVGARACTGYGTHVTADLAGAAASAGRVIVSGAAYGVDAVAHRTALAAGRRTVAVLAGGADRVYPAAHDTLIARIREQGAVCAELVPGTAPTRWRFLQRNRLIAALSGATLVTEAGVRSGSLNTAGHAATLGRPIGAVPGPMTSAASSGCHRLIREYGAALISSEHDLAELLEDAHDAWPGPSAGGASAGEAPAGEGSAGEAPAGEAPAGEGSVGEAPAGIASGGAAAAAERTRAAAPEGADDRQPVLHRRVLDALPLRGSRSVEEVARHAGVEPGDAQRALAELHLLGEVTRRDAPGPEPYRWALRRG